MIHQSLNATTQGLFFALSVMLAVGCAAPAPQGPDFEPAPAVESKASAPDDEGFVWKTEQFADLKLIRYQIPGWDKLSPKQQALVYCLNMAGLSGRDIMYDQNNRYNLRIRRLMEDIYVDFEGDRSTKGWVAFEVYLKRIWFSTASTTTTRTPSTCLGLGKHTWTTCWPKRATASTQIACRHF